MCPATALWWRTAPIEATGTLSVRETVVGNQVESLWEENVVAKNISNKPILLLIGVLEAGGPSQ